MEKLKINNRRLSVTEHSTVAKMKFYLKRRLPIISWLPRYSVGDLLADSIAGLTVGLTVVPQSMAYAAIAGLSPEYGLYSSYIGCFLYILFGSCRQVTIGPTAVMGLLTYETCGPNFAECAILTGFYSGIFELLMALLQLGWVVSFISQPVTVGFTSAAAFTIISSQLSNLLGLSGKRGNGFIGYCLAFFRNFKTIQINDAVLGLSSFLAILFFKKLGDLKPRPTKGGKLLKSILRIVSISRNVVIILVTSTMAYLWTSQKFNLTGNVQGGFPPMKLPEFKLPVKHQSNLTHGHSHAQNMTDSAIVENTEYLSFVQTWEFLGTGPLMIALISVLQNVAISKSFGNGQSIDGTQEMFALGMSNVVGGFFSAIPISGSFSRSAINEASGVRTPGGSFYTGTIVLLSLSFLTPTFHYIPKASLSAVIICAVMFMIDLKVLVPMWKISRMDFLACFITFCCSLIFGMEYGILIGVGISLSALLSKSLRPHLNYELKTDSKNGVQYLFIEPSDGVQFPSMDFLHSSISKVTIRHYNVQVLVLNFNNWSSWDYTCTSTFVSLNEGIKRMGKFLVFLHCKRDWIEALGEAGLKDPNCFRDSYLEECLRKVTHLRSTSFLNFNVVDDSEESSHFRR